MNNPIINYEGKQIEIPLKERKKHTPYLPSKELVEAVNLAILLERPLLLGGEPGCGKTKLAQAVAYELDLPLELWCIKSTSHAKDGLYMYDTLGRLRDAQLAAAGQLYTEQKNEKDYIKFGPLGRSFLSDKKTIVLIDEIDKADIDFPNDLLHELDELSFVIEETGERVDAIHTPIIFITTNEEKELSHAFLRRCLFHYIEFPNRETLHTIIEAHFPASEFENRKKIVNRFINLREEMESRKGKMGKKVSTSELLEWFSILNKPGNKDKIENIQNGVLPFASVLLKQYEDLRYKDKSDKGHI